MYPQHQPRHDMTIADFLCLGQVNTARRPRMRHRQKLCYGVLQQNLGDLENKRSNRPDKSSHNYMCMQAVRVDWPRIIRTTRSIQFKVFIKMDQVPRLQPGFACATSRDDQTRWKRKPLHARIGSPYPNSLSC
jgi:hypothetical protein